MVKGEYVNQVLMLLNEAGMMEREGVVFEGADNSGVVRFVTNVYVDAWRKAVSIVPHSWLNVSDFGEHPHDLHDGSGYLTVPDDWYLLYCFKMKGWKREVYRTAEDGDEVARLQGSEYSRGTALHPVCVLGLDGDGGRVLRYYSLPRGVRHEVERALYVPVCPRIEGWEDERDLGLDRRLSDVVCQFAASLISLRVENYNAAKAFEREAVVLTHGLMLNDVTQGV